MDSAGVVDDAFLMDSGDFVSDGFFIYFICDSWGWACWPWR